VNAEFDATDREEPLPIQPLLDEFFSQQRHDLLL
jgi:hypothetical protein